MSEAAEPIKATKAGVEPLKSGAEPPGPDEPTSITLPNGVTIEMVVEEPPTENCIALCSTDNKGGAGSLNRFVFTAAGLDAAEDLPRDYSEKIARVDSGEFPILVFPTVSRSHIGNTTLTQGLLLRGLIHSLRAIDDTVAEDVPVWMSLMGTGSGKLTARQSVVLTYLALATHRFRRPRRVILSLDHEEERSILSEIARGALLQDLTIQLEADALEGHVAGALLRANHLAAEAPVINGAHLLAGILSEKFTGISEAFQELSQIVPAGFASEEADTKATAKITLSPWLFMSWYLGQVHIIQGKGKMWGRDLITLLLLSGDPALEQALSGVASTSQTTRERWREFIKRSPKPYAPEDWDNWWHDAGFLGDEELPTRTGYSAENTRAKDKLGVESDAIAFARLIADKNTIPPLSIGLLGDWGSGKSFFMNLIEQHVDKLKGTNGYCTEVRQIPFNAWHMLDSNLWASLVGHIFQELLPEKDAEADELARQIENADGAVAEAKRELKVAAISVDKARKELAAVEEKLKFTQFIQAIAATLKKPEKGTGEGEEEDEEAEPEDPAILAQVKLDLEDFKKQVEGLQSDAEGLGFTAPEGLLDLETLRERAEETRGSWAAVMNALPQTPYLRIVLLTLLAAVVVGLLITKVSEADALSPLLEETLKGIAAVVTVLGSLLGSVAAVFASATRVAGDFIDKIKQTQAKSKPLISRKKRLQSDYDSHDRLVKKLADAQDHLSDLERQKKDIASGERLRSFIESRAQSSDYTSQQGLISLVRQDFRKLEALMKDRDSERKANPKAASTFNVDRIVLYIDDLDRCPPKRVVEVLEAIHLLLSFELFIVIVAVDSRWLLKSLEVHYHDLLFIDGNSKEASEDYRRTTPQNYLEKIFQVTFALAPMQSDHFSDYMKSLAEGGGNVDELSTEDSQKQFDNLFSLAAPESAEPESPEPEPAPEISPDDGSKSGTAADAQEQATDTLTDWVALTGRPETNPLIITRSEREVLASLNTFLDTPRQAKRVVNVYRLLKAPLNAEERAKLEASKAGHHQLVLLLLAILYGRPQVANQFLRHLYEKTQLSSEVPFGPACTRLLLALKELIADEKKKEEENGKEKNRKLSDLLQALHDEIERIDPDVYIWEDSRAWIGRIGRFSLMTGPDWHTWTPYAEKDAEAEQ